MDYLQRMFLKKEKKINFLHLGAISGLRLAQFNTGNN